MKVMVVDDEFDALEALEKELRRLPEITEMSCFDDPAKALDYIGNQPCDIAFLDIEMYGITGLALAKQIREKRPMCNIVFVTGYAQYAIDAFALSASDYLLKPADGASIRRALDNLRNPPQSKLPLALHAQTFGNFEVYSNGKPLAFSRTKTKELLAYLISRQGAFCSNHEIIAVLWEDRAESSALQSHLRNLVSDLAQTLRGVKSGHVLVRQRGGLAIAPENLNCDFYDFLRGDPQAVNRYTGEFMAQYSWAEFTNGYLEHRV